MSNIKTCDICGVTSNTKKITYHKGLKMPLCDKHYAQYKNHNKFFDNSKITINDMNEIVLDSDNNVAYIILYNKYGIEINRTIIDIDDVSKRKDKRWRTSHKRNKIYVVTGSPTKNNMEYLARYILDYSGKLEVDHIDGDSLNNKKSNLRIIEKRKNLYNMSPKNISTTGIRGISMDSKNGRYTIDFSCNKKRLYLKPMRNLEDAVYLRYLCEIKFQKEFRYIGNDEFIFSYINKLSEEKKQEIEHYLNTKIKENKYNVN